MSLFLSKPNEEPHNELYSIPNKFRAGVVRRMVFSLNLVNQIKVVEAEGNSSSRADT